LGGRSKGPPLKDAIVLVPSDSYDEDYEFVNKLVDAAVLSKSKCSN
jgi:hypothetical protein